MPSFFTKHNNDDPTKMQDDYTHVGSLFSEHKGKFLWFVIIAIIAVALWVLRLVGILTPTLHMISMLPLIFAVLGVYLWARKNER